LAGDHPSDTSGQAPTPIAADSRPGRVIAVLGMHRSGTSAVAGTLEQRGLFLGQVSTQDRHNPRGNREHPEVRRLHNQMLRDSGGSWHAPPAVVEWRPGHFDYARSILAKHSGHAVWGFKDPRTLLVLEGWQQLVPDIEYVGVFRHPARVAQSLAARPEMPVENPFELWRVHNVQLLEIRRRVPFPLLCFDDEAATLARKLEQAAKALHLADEATGEPFFAPRLRRVEAGHVQLPPEVGAIYEELRALAI
jgi:hypothetical protein